MLIFFRSGIVGSATVIADDAQHGLAVFGIAGKGRQFCCHFRRRGIGFASHDGGYRPADRQCFGRVVGNPLPHQHRPHVGIAEPQRAELVTLLGNGTAGERSHQHTNLQDDRPETHSMAKILQLQLSLSREKLAEVERG